MKSCVEILRGLREDKDLKQSDIANLIGTTQQQYSKYETGESELSIRALEILADYYVVSTDYLLGRTECREGVDALNKKVSAEHTVGAHISDLLSLDAASRAAVADYLSLQKMRQACAKKKEKDGPRR